MPIRSLTIAAAACSLPGAQAWTVTNGMRAPHATRATTAMSGAKPMEVFGLEVPAPLSDLVDSVQGVAANIEVPNLNIDLDAGAAVPIVGIGAAGAFGFFVLEAFRPSVEEELGFENGAITPAMMEVVEAEKTKRTLKYKFVDPVYTATVKPALAALDDAKEAADKKAKEAKAAAAEAALKKAKAEEKAKGLKDGSLIELPNPLKDLGLELPGVGPVTGLVVPNPQVVAQSAVETTVEKAKATVEEAKDALPALPF